jgi:tetratricopeptide (TPR) repeat protein
MKLSPNRRIARVVSSAFIALSATFVQAQSHSPEWCDERWEAESTGYGGSEAEARALLERWQGHAGNCSGTAVYEAHLATIYLELGQTGKAKAALAPVSSRKSAYSHFVEMQALRIEMAEATSGQNSNFDLSGFRNKLLAFTRKYPNWSPGYSMLGAMESVDGKHEEAVSHLTLAIKNLESGKEEAPNTWGIYRNLAISFAALHRYEEAKEAGEIAFRLNRATMSDQHFMYAMAIANAGMGNVREATTTLRLIAAKKPEVRNDPEFLAAVEFVRKQAKEH